MNQRSRRDFLTDVGTGMVVASIGAGLAADLGFSTAFANQGPERLTFGAPGTSGQPDARNGARPAVAPGGATVTARDRICANWWPRRPWPMPAPSAARITSAFTP